jgi:hypothetical protein
MDQSVPPHTPSPQIGDHGCWTKQLSQALGATRHFCTDPLSAQGTVGALPGPTSNASVAFEQLGLVARDQDAQHEQNRARGEAEECAAQPVLHAPAGAVYLGRDVRRVYCEDEASHLDRSCKRGDEPPSGLAVGITPQIGPWSGFRRC